MPFFHDSSFKSAITTNLCADDHNGVQVYNVNLDSLDGFSTSTAVGATTLVTDTL